MALDTDTLPKAQAKKTPASTLGLSFGVGLPPIDTAAGAAPAYNSLEARLNRDAMQGLINERGTPNPSGFEPYLSTVYGEPKKPNNIGFYSVNRNTQALPGMTTAETPTAPAAPAVAPIPTGTAPPAASKTASQSIIDWANQAPTSEQKGTRLALAAKMMGAEAQTTSAGREPGGRSSLQGLQDLGVETTYNEMGQPVQTTKRTAVYDPTTSTMVPVKLPTIAAKAPLPPKADLKSGQNYPGYGTWTGTGFKPQ